MRTTNETSPDARAADDFDARKSAAMAELVFADDADAERADRSRAGRVDARATACVRAVCASRDYFTTSSCSGRVSAFGEPKMVCKTEDGSIARDGGQVNKGGVWAYVSHDPANAEDVLRAVREVEATDAKEALEGDGSASEGTTLVLRFEPFILSVEARTPEAGAKFVKLARDCGYRESGVTASDKRVICAVRCQIRMEAPVTVRGKRIVDDDGVRALVGLANEKFAANAARMERFRLAFEAATRAEDESSAAGASSKTDVGSAMKRVEVKKEVAKRVKDALKKCGWMDNGRKSTTRMDESGQTRAVVLPVKRGVESLFAADASLLSPDAITVLRAIENGDASIEDDDDEGCLEQVAVRAQNPLTLMKQEVSAMLASRGLNADLAQEVPARWEKLGNLVLIPSHAFTASDFKTFEDELYAMVARVLGASRVARQAPVSQGPKRESRAVVLHPKGADGWVETKELGVTYGLDVTKVMFSSGNGTEKARMGNLGVRGETVVDLFAGIGYYTLQLLKNAGVGRVYACEWNPNSCAALRHNLRINGVESRCEVLEGDNRRMAPTGVADRVLLGLLPHAEMSWETAVKALKPRGGVLHVHSNVNSGEEETWMARLVDELTAIARRNGRDDLDFAVEHLERVKWYGPRIRHVVCDVRCTSRVHKDANVPATNKTASKSAPQKMILSSSSSSKSVERIHRPTPQDFSSGPAARRVPAVVTGLDIGQAPWKWTPAYMASLEGVPEKLVSVHVSDVPKLDFVRKNFKYEVMPFGELLEKVADETDAKFYYLRSIGENARKEPAHAMRQFPAFEEDLRLPIEFWGGEDNYFSAVIRVSSGDLQLWTHYDAMDNMLIQLHGEKRVLLFPPSVAGDLYLEGSSSTVRDVDNHDAEAFPRFARARSAALEVTLQPGDVLYIPALWSHHVTALHGPSIALNVFYRHLPADQYPSKDLYGNADPIAAANAMKSLESAMDSLKQLPRDYRVFYGGVAAARLESHLGVDAARQAFSRVDTNTRNGSTNVNARVKIATLGLAAFGVLKSIIFNNKSR